MEPSQLLARAMQGFDMSEVARSVRDQTNQLQQATEGWRSRSQVPVLAIDEAHMLPPDTLAAVIHLATETGNNGLRTLMLGEPQLAEMINEAVGGGSEHNMVHLVDIPAFNASQAAQYLRHRLRCAGLDAEALFPDEVANRLFRSTAGLPGRLNAAARDQLADRFASLEQHAARPAPARSPLWRRGPLQALSAALLVGLASVLWLTAQDRAPLPQGLNLGPSEEPAGPAPIYRGPPPGEVVALSSARVTPLETAESEVPSTEAAAFLSEPEAKPVEPVAEPAGSGEVSLGFPSVQTAPEPRPAIVPEPVPETEVPAPARSNPAFLEPSPAPPARRAAVEKSVERQTAPKAVPAPTPAARQSFIAGLQDEAWLLGQDPSHYTVQLTGTHDRDAALSFVRTHALEDKAAWFRTRHKDRDWYVVVTGVYSEREQAQAAIRTLPAGLKQQGPWARTFASIQASVAVTSEQ